MSATWPWVILGRVPRVVPIPSDAEAEITKMAPAVRAVDFTIRVARPPRATVFTVDPLAHPDPNDPDSCPYILAAGPDCLLLNFAVAPFYGVHSEADPHETYLVVARRFRTSGVQVQRGHAVAPVGERIPGRRGGDGSMPATYKVESVGLVASYDGEYTVAELRVDKGANRARLFRFYEGDDGWVRDYLSSPLAAEDRGWVPDGVVAQKNTLWWFDLSWGLLSCDVVVDEPVLLFHKLPEDRALGMARPDFYTHRCVAVSRRELRYVEIVTEDGGDFHDTEAATVSMWTRLMAKANPAWWEWEKKYAMSFEKLWNDDTYMDTGLPRKVPVLSAVCPSNPDLVYFSLEQRLFGVNVPVHKVVEIADEPHELVKTPWPAPASCRYVHAWNLPPQVAVDLDLVRFSSSEDEDQEEEPEVDEEELYKLGLQAIMRMDPTTLQSEVEKFVHSRGGARKNLRPRAWSTGSKGPGSATV